MNAEAWADEAFDAPLTDDALPIVEPGTVPLRLSLLAMALVILAFALPIVGSLAPLYVSGLALRRLAQMPHPQRRRVPLVIRLRVRRRAMSAAGFAALFAVLWGVYLF